MITEHLALGPLWPIGAYIGIVGLVVGSWIAEVAAAASTPTTCAACGPKASWKRRVPVVSWFYATRPCSGCEHLGQPERPVIELATAALFAGLTMALYGNTSPWVILAVLYATGAGIALSAIDLRVMLLPDRIVLPTMAVVAVLLAVAALGQGDFWPLARALIGGAGLFVAYFIIALISPKGMGFGDVKLAGLLGLLLAWFGWPYLLVGAVLPYLIGTVGVFGALAFRPRRQGKVVPFGPSMVAGALIAVAFGTDITSWWLSLFEPGATL